MRKRVNARRIPGLRAALLCLLAAVLPLRADAAGLRTVATFSVLGDWVKNVGGDAVALTTLVGPDGDPHMFDPSPKEGVALAEAAVVFEVGLGFEPWLDGLYASTRSRARRVVVSRGLTPRYGEDHGRREADPHLWLDPRRAIRMVEAVRDALAAADPGNTETYRRNAEGYTGELRALDRWIAGQVRTVPPARRVLVTAHNSFGYFAGRYGFRALGSALESVTTESAEPAADRMAALIQRVRANRVPALFPEKAHSSKLIERLAAEAEVPLARPLYTGGLGRPGTPEATYLGMMRYNVRVLVEALRP